MTKQNSPVSTVSVSSENEKMGGKPVFTVPSSTVMNMNSGFGHKLLCDDLTFTAGSTCAYSCAFCYVGSILRKNAPIRKIMDGTGLGFQNIVVRRESPVELLRKQLTDRKGNPKFKDPDDNRVVFASPLVDIAANLELANETAEMCRTILELTNWRIRILSKSPLITRIADQIPDHWQSRIIYGLSTGTLDDGVAKSIEIGTPLVSKRLEALHRLQDRGLRTYGMACPILPMDDHGAYARQVADALHVDRCEHVWAEALNVRGPSMIQTREGLRAAGHHHQAELLERVSSDRDVWEDYARRTFLALAKVIPADKLRFLQYVRKDTRDWWQEHERRGAVLLGKATKGEVII